MLNVHAPTEEPQDKTKYKQLEKFFGKLPKHDILDSFRRLQREI